jgi:chromosomal replication initiator protein
MISIRAIVDAVCEESGYSRLILLSERRPAPIFRARAIAMWLAARYSGQASAVIGRHMGGRDHTTVLHAVRAVEKLCLADPAFARRVAALDRQIALAAEALERMGVVEADIDPGALAAEILQSRNYRRAATVSVREIVALAETGCVAA